jgi:hypothetical protein
MRSATAVAALITSLWCLIPVLPAAADCTILTMDTLPENVGWLVIGSPTVSLASNVLTIETTGVNFGGYEAPAAQWAAVASAPGGWCIVATVRLVSFVDPGFNTDAIEVQIRTPATGHIFQIFPDHIAIFPFPYVGILTYSMNTMDTAHTYAISGSGQSIAVLVDGVLRLSAVATNTLFAGSLLHFGDFTSGVSSPSVSDWTYFSFCNCPPVSVVPTVWTDVKRLYR